MQLTGSSHGVSFAWTRQTYCEDDAAIPYLSATVMFLEYSIPSGRFGCCWQSKPIALVSRSYRALGHCGSAALKTWFLLELE